MMTAAAADPLLPVELSHSWAQIRTGKIPEFVDVFCLVGIEPESERYVGWGYYLSTSEKPGWWAKCRGAVMNLASVRVPLRERTQEGLTTACKEASILLSKTIWKSPAVEYVRFRNKLAEDLTFWKEQEGSGKVAGLIVERVDDRTFTELLKGARRI